MANENDNFQTEDGYFIKAPPPAAPLVSALRELGYSLGTALADLIDNSITAHATMIDVLIESTSSDPSLAVIDNGNGMSREELQQAMILGARDPNNDPGLGALGRFGLGLKTASFSQCRR